MRTHTRTFLRGQVGFVGGSSAYSYAIASGFCFYFVGTWCATAANRPICADLVVEPGACCFPPLDFSLPYSYGHVGTTGAICADLVVQPGAC